MVIKSYPHKGFSLLEILLVVSVMSLLLGGAARIFDDWAKDRVNSKVAVEMRNLQNAAEGYVQFNANAILINDVPNIGDVANIDLQNLINDGFLPSSYDGVNAFRQSMRVIVRHLDSDPSSGSVLEVLSVTEDQNNMDSRMIDSRLFKAAMEGGTNVGIVSSLALGPNCCQGNIQSIYGTWSVDLIDFAAVYNPTPSQAQGGYMAAYSRVRTDNDQDYLYRVEVEGRPELNRMNTNLYMNNNDIENMGVLASDNITVTGDLNLNRQNSPYVLSVRNDFDVGGDILILSSNSTKGDIIVHGDSDNLTPDLNITGTLNVLQDNNLPTGNISAETMTTGILANTQQAIMTDTTSIQGSNLNANNLYAVGMTASNVITTDTLQSSAASGINAINASNALIQTLTVTNGLNTASSIDIQDSFGVEGASSMSSIQGTGTVYIQNLVCSNPADCP